MLSLGQIRSHLLYKFKSNQELVSAIATLWQNFTSQRMKLDDYLKDEKLGAAYTAFYLLSNYQKLQRLLEYAHIDPDVFEDYHFYDIGCGPGTFSLAFSELVFGHDEKIVGIESSPVMRQQATMLLSGLGIKQASVIDGVHHRLEGKKLALFGHSINEMKSEKACKYIQQIDPDVIMVIEPGTKESFQELLTFRQKMLEQSYHCLYPCPTNASCPMMLTDDWCHQYMKIQMEPEVASIAQELHLDRQLQAVSCFIFAKDPNFTLRAQKRLVRFYRQTKHSFDWQICKEYQQGNYLQDLEVTKKNMSKRDVKVVSDIFPGQEVAYTEVKELPDKVRVQLDL